MSLNTLNCWSSTSLPMKSAGLMMPASVWLQYKYEKEFYFDKEYMTRDRYIDIDIDHEVISYMREQWQVKSEDEVVKALDYLPEDSVRTAFNRNTNVLIAATRGMRFHIDKFEVNEEELKDISFII